MKKIIKSILFMLAASTGFVLTSCSDDDLSTADALFRPILTEYDNIEHGLDTDLVPYMTIKWDQFIDATDYVVSVAAEDGSDTQSITTDTTTCTFRNLQYDKVYNVKIRCVNSITGLESKDFTLKTTSLDYPTKLKTPSTSDIIDVAARISWADESYDSLQIVRESNDSIVMTIVPTEEQNEEKMLIVEGLSPKTTYLVRAYINDEYYGKKRFTTEAEENYGDDVVIDLRDLTDKESSSAISSARISADVEENPDQNITYVLRGGVRYNISGVALPAFKKRIKFVTGLTLAGNAIFTPKNFTVAAGIELEAVEFEKIDFTSGNDIRTVTAKSFGGNQVFNINSSNSIVKNIKFKSCNISCYRAVVRGQTGDDNIYNVVFEDCVIDGIGDQGVVTNADKGGDFRTVTAKNCTFTNIVMFCDLRKTKNDVTLNFENCTFCYAPLETTANANTPLFRLGSNPAALNISKTLFGPSLASTDGNGSEPITPYKSGEKGSILMNATAVGLSVENSYKTTFEYTKINENIYGIDNLEDCKSTETELWRNPQDGDFTVQGKLAGAGVGDSRWFN